MPEHHKHAVISFSTASIIKVALLVLLFFFLFAIRNVVLMVLVATVIASAVEPAADWFAKWGIKRALAVVIVYLIAILGLAAVFYFFIPALISETLNIISLLPSYVDNAQAWIAKEAAIFNNTFSVTVPTQIPFQVVADQMKNALLSFSGGAFSTAMNVFGGVFTFVMIFILSFYLAIQKNGVEDFLKIITPKNYQFHVTDVWKRTQLKIGRWVQGQLMLMIIVTCLVFLGLTLLGIEHAFLFAVVAGVFEIIPIFGPIFAAVPAIIVALAQGGPFMCLMVALMFFIIQQLENHLIYPMVFNKVVGIPPIVSILAFIIGGTLGGLLGVILSVPAAALVMEIASDIQKRHAEKGEV